MPKNSGLINENEREIGARLKLFRKSKHWSQSSLAQIADISRDKLASIECGRTPLRYGVGGRICLILGINQQWLAEGKEPREYYISIKPWLERQIPRRLLFSVAYHRFLKNLINEHFEEIATTHELKNDELTELHDTIRPNIGSVGQPEVLIYSAKFIKRVTSILPPHLMEPFFKVLNLASADFQAKYQSEIDKWSKGTSLSQANDEKKSASQCLTYGTELRTNADVKFTMAWLRRRLSSLTAERGMKRELASVLGVPHTRVSEWLSGKSEPTGQTTLRLLQWVLSKSKSGKLNKNPGSATNTTRARTRKRQSNENLKSDPP